MQHHPAITRYLKGESPYIQHRGVVLLPVLHEGMEWAAGVREALLDIHPRAVGVELPETLNPHLEHAAALLPGLGVIKYSTSRETPFHIIIESTDPLWECVRTGLDLHIPVRFIDKDLEDYPAVPEQWPDSFVLSRLGYHTMCRTLLELPPPPEPPEEEPVGTVAQGTHLMADHLREETMAFHLAELVSAHGDPVVGVCGLHHVPHIIELLDTELVRPLGKVKRKGVELFSLSEESARVIPQDGGWFRSEYEKWRQTADTPLPSRYEMMATLLMAASAKYKTEFKSDVSLETMKKCLTYGRNLAIVAGLIAPRVYEIVVAARSMVDHDFGWITHQLLTDPLAGSDRFKSTPSMDLTLEDLGHATQLIRFQRRLKQRAQRMLHLVKTRPKETFPGEWGDLSDENSICSFQPEDVVIEDYAGELQRKGKSLMGEIGHRVRPFTDSLMDGLDVRETLRRWHEGRIYVQEEFQTSGTVGSVVIIFDYDDDDNKGEQYPYKMTWLGEHAQESDMAFYATTPGEAMVGPGISRCEYGGLLMTYPPRRMWPIWQDPWLNWFEKKADILLAAALQLTQERLVAYVAPKPPSNVLKRLAGRMGLKVVYMPVGSFPPAQLNAIKHFHILKNQKTRDIAPLYILD